MRSVAWVPPIALVLLFPTMGLVIPGPAPSQGPTYDSSWAAGFRDALEWSTVHKDKLVAPLVAGAGMGGYAADVIGAYEEGVEWAARTLAESASPALLDARVRALVAGVTGETIIFTRAAEVPETMVAPVSTLLAAQLRVAARAPVVFDPALAPMEAQRVLAMEGAWVLGVIDGTLPELRKAEAPEEPVFLDPIGLVIIGGEGDDVYEPQSVAGVTFSPVLMIEPGGNDVFLIPIASNGYVPSPLPSQFSDVPTGSTNIGVDLAGDDTYALRPAVARRQLSVLVDEQGSDVYGSTTQSYSTASVVLGGLAFLADRAGDDAYFARDHGLAYAHAGLVPLAGGGTQAGVSVLADWSGSDLYEADTGQTGGFTHAAGENVGAMSVLRDYGGDDEYASDRHSFAVAEDDANVLFMDDAGADSKFTDNIGLTSMGRKAVSEGGLSNAPLGRSIAYYLDGGGVDSFEWNSPIEGTTMGNDHTRVIGDPDHRWGVFVDCESSPDDRLPCEDQQDEVLTQIATSAVP